MTENGENESGEEEEGEAVARAKQALGGRKGFETRRQKQEIAARLFGRAPTPVSLDRYTVLRELGAGGMGMVYLGYDDQLDRRVAIKLLRGSRADEEAQSRLQREAQAMARLSHPNVVTVYEVGRLEHELYVAMEYVKGSDLRVWLEAEHRPWVEVHALFLQAGSGLAAAHAAGIIHRDFKPDNVLVGEDGRARVADFGLAAAREGAGKVVSDAAVEDEVTFASTASGSQNQLEVQLTRTGKLMGTPAYMAPEQYEGGLIDARSDQFSFCVALWEGLYGERPFAGDTLLDLALAVRSGVREDPPSERAALLPDWLRPVLERGLALDPDERWPDMVTLLAALGEDPLARRRRRRRLALIIGLTGSLIAGLATVAGLELNFNTRQRYWNGLTEDLLGVERSRGLRQAQDDAERATDTTKLGAYRRYQVDLGLAEQRDPTVAAMLLAAVGPQRQASEAWVSAANMSLGRPLSHARLDGHQDTVRALRLSPDARLLYSAAADGEVWRWALDSGRGRVLHRHGGPVTELALSRDGSTLVSVSEDGSALAWATGGDSAARHIALLEAGITSVNFDPSGARVVLGSRAGQARIVPLDGGASIVLSGHEGPVYAARFDPSGTRLVTAGADARVRIWAADEGALLATLEGHKKAVFHAAFLDAERLVTASDDGSAHGWVFDSAAGTFVAADFRLDLAGEVAALAVWGSKVALGSTRGQLLVGDFERPGEAKFLAPHTDGVWSLVFMPDGEALVSASFDASARVSPLSGGAPRILRGHRERLWTLALGSEGRWLVTGGFDTQIRSWDLARPSLDFELSAGPGTVYALAVHDEQVLTAAAGHARLFDAAGGTQLAELETPHAWNAGTFISRDPSSLIALGDNAGKLVLWDPEKSGTDHASQLLGQHRAAIRDLAASPDGRRLASASSDHELRLWALDSDEAVVLRGHTDKVMQVRFSADGRRLASASLDGDLRIWSGVDGRPLVRHESHEGPIRALAASPDGRSWATGSDDHSARLWPDDDPAHAIALRGHEGRVVGIRYDARGERLVTCSADHTLKVWDTRDGSLIQTLLGHGGTVWGADFLADDRIVSHADDNSIRVWQLDRSHPPIVLRGHSSGVHEFALGGQWFVSAAGPSVKLWQLGQLSHDPAELARRLSAATISCLSEPERRIDLGEGAEEAAFAFTACESGRGR